MEYKKSEALMQRQRFIQWMREQPQKDNPAKRYSDSTIEVAASKLESGCKLLGIEPYENVNCFNIMDTAEFHGLYHICYQAAENLDKQQGH